MVHTKQSDDPEWHKPLEIRLTPEIIVRTVFATAEIVHTGWESCIDTSLVISETAAMQGASGDHCRLVEQHYNHDEEPEVTWHDWTVELRIGEVFVSAHWQAPEDEGPATWYWCAAEAESAFANACLLIGKRVRRAMVVEGDDVTAAPPRSQQH